MSTQECLTSACRYCRFYQPEGMHGGVCQQLSVPVRSEWKACQLAMPAFSPSWAEWQDLLPTPDRAIPVAIAGVERQQIASENTSSAVESRESTISCMNDLEIFAWQKDIAAEKR
jgi:hypothetical protein